MARGWHGGHMTLLCSLIYFLCILAPSFRPPQTAGLEPTLLKGTNFQLTQSAFPVGYTRRYDSADIAMIVVLINYAIASVDQQVKSASTANKSTSFLRHL